MNVTGAHRGRDQATIVGLLLAVLAGGADATNDFVNFETGQVRPLALSPDRSRLFAINTPDNRLEIFAVAVELCTAVAPRSPASSNDTTSRFVGEGTFPGPATCAGVP